MPGKTGPFCFERNIVFLINGKRLNAETLVNPRSPTPQYLFSSKQ